MTERNEMLLMINSNNALPNSTSSNFRVDLSNSLHNHEILGYSILQASLVNSFPNILTGYNDSLTTGLATDTIPQDFYSKDEMATILVSSITGLTSVAFTEVGSKGRFVLTFSSTTVIEDSLLARALGFNSFPVATNTVHTSPSLHYLNIADVHIHSSALSRANCIVPDSVGSRLENIFAVIPNDQEWGKTVYFVPAHPENYEINFTTSRAIDHIDIQLKNHAGFEIPNLGSAHPVMILIKLYF